MNELEIFKALSNPIRLNIIKWLKEPQNNFPPQGLHVPEGDRFDRSVCVGSICESFPAFAFKMRIYMKYSKMYLVY